MTKDFISNLLFDPTILFWHDCLTYLMIPEGDRLWTPILTYEDVIINLLYLSLNFLSNIFGVLGFGEQLVTGFYVNILRSVTYCSIILKV
jgi:hypothetical protein